METGSFPWESIKKIFHLNTKAQLNTQGECAESLQELLNLIEITFNHQQIFSKYCTQIAALGFFHPFAGWSHMDYSSDSSGPEVPESTIQFSCRFSPSVEREVSLKEVEHPCFLEVENLFVFLTNDTVGRL